MNTDRLEAFSDGVIAIIITIMVLELKTPHGQTLEALRPLLPVFSSYVLSFVYVGIYWNNHHHLFHAVERVSGPLLWANLHLLFWLSLIPFATAWMGENHFSVWPVAAYGAVLLMCALAYSLMTRAILSQGSRASKLARAIGRDIKGNASIVCYVAAIGLAFVSPWISCALYVGVAIVWFVPDLRIERQVVE